MYRLLIRPLLYLLPAETAHHLAIGALRLLQLFPFLLRALARFFRPSPKVGVRAMGIDFPSPIGLGAGFDKDGRVFDALGALGFGFVEIGTVTAEGQPGNPKPRLFRLPQDRALLNRMGFNNSGSRSLAERLARRGRKGRPVLGINIGKTKVTPAEEAPSDYAKSAELLAPHADYLVVNVSSPNTPGLRDLQATESLRPILEAVKGAIQRSTGGRKVPLLVKIAPDLSDEDVLLVADLALELELDGIVATNTTIARAGLTTDPAKVDALGAGGLSGAPLKRRSFEVLSLLSERVQGRCALISAGGIESVQDVQERLARGATLVQIYSSLVYEGPGLPSRLARGLASRSE